MKMTADQVIDALIRRFHTAAGHARHEWIVCREFRMGSGFTTSERRIDLWAINVQPSKGNPAVAYEVKVSRSDFLRDIKDPHKHQHARLFSDRFYFAAPEGLIRATEVPDWAGLIEIGEPKYDERPYVSGHHHMGENFWRKISVTREAPLLTKHAPSWPVVVSLLRRVPAANGSEFEDLFG